MDLMLDPGHKRPTGSALLAHKKARVDTTVVERRGNVSKVPMVVQLDPHQASGDVYVRSHPSFLACLLFLEKNERTNSQNEIESNSVSLECRSLINPTSQWRMTRRPSPTERTSRARWKKGRRRLGSRRWFGWGLSLSISMGYSFLSIACVHLAFDPCQARGGFPN